MFAPGLLQNSENHFLDLKKNMSFFMLFFSSHFRNAVKCQDSVNSYHRNYRKKSKNHFDFVGVCLLVSKPYEDKLGPMGSILSVILYWTFHRYFCLIPFEIQRFWVGIDGILAFYRISETLKRNYDWKKINVKKDMFVFNIFVIWGWSKLVPRGLIEECIMFGKTLHVFFLDLVYGCTLCFYCFTAMLLLLGLLPT